MRVYKFHSQTTKSIIASNIVVSVIFITRKASCLVSQKEPSFLKPLQVLFEQIEQFAGHHQQSKLTFSSFSKNSQDQLSRVISINTRGTIELFGLYQVLRSVAVSQKNLKLHAVHVLFWSLQLERFCGQSFLMLLAIQAKLSWTSYKRKILLSYQKRVKDYKLNKYFIHLWSRTNKNFGNSLSGQVIVVLFWWIQVCVIIFGECEVILLLLTRQVLWMEHKIQFGKQDIQLLVDWSRKYDKLKDIHASFEVQFAQICRTRWSLL